MLIVFDGLAALFFSAVVLLLKLLDLFLFKLNLLLETLQAFLATSFADLLELGLQAYQLLVKCIIYFLVSLTLKREFLDITLLELDSVDELANISSESADDPA